MWEILVPASLKKVRFTYAHHKEWDEFVKVVAGGLTVMRGAKGEWISPSGELFRDRMIPVRISCTEDDIREIIKFTIKHYDQEAVLAYEVSENVLLIRKDESIEQFKIEQYSQVYFSPNLPKGIKNQYPFKEKHPYIFFGEIPNMPGHCIVMDNETKELYSGYHTDHFTEMPEDEI